MDFSIDTNVIIGIVNHKDRLHNASLNLMKSKQNEKLVICQGALIESQSFFSNRINEIMTATIQFLPDFFQTSKLSVHDSQIILINMFKKLKEQMPERINVLDLVFDSISTFLQNGNDVRRIPSFLSQLALTYSNLTIPKLENIHPIEKSIHLNFKTLSTVKQCTKDVYFKDTHDERIFQELMTNLNEILPIEFFSDDKEFVKKSAIGYEKISNDLQYGKNAFSSKLLEESINS